MKNMNPKHIEAIIYPINRAPYFVLLSMEVKEICGGYSRVEV